MTKDIVVVGGGTAGWLAALVANKVFPEHSITLVESADIGILGAGEGSTPHLAHLFRELDISLTDLILHTSSTIKNGIVFDGWSSTRRPYLQGFGVWDHQFQREVLNPPPDKTLDWTNAPLLPYLAEHLGMQEDEVELLTYATLRNKVFFGRDNFEQLGEYALHFDARSLAKFLAAVATSRGVTRIEGTVSNVATNENGNISHIYLDGDRKVSGDFFFDCSGFARLLIGKVYESEWVSFKDILPAKRAMPFFLDQDEEIWPYTRSKAMDYGWMWQIPLQHRYGCGYVYDPDQISDEDVKTEIDTFFGHEVTVPRIFNFDPGYFKSPWIKNCLALGLSSGFVEPLEATSIMQMITSMQIFFRQKHMVFTDNEDFKAVFNAKMVEDQIDIASFIHIHYITDKTNTDFWKNFSKNYSLPDRISNTMQRLYNGILSEEDDTGGHFDSIQFLTLARGHGILNQESISSIYETSIKARNLEPELDRHIKRILAATEDLADHTEFLKHLGSGSRCTYWPRG